MQKFENLFNIFDLTTILDVGGTTYNWRFINSQPKITIVNISPLRDWDDHKEQFIFVIVDGTALSFKDRSFDIAYSNSVIEHLGTWENQEKFAQEIGRVGKAYYVQTPAKEFLFEPHLLTPFIHWLPKNFQSRLLRNFTLWGIITRPSHEYIDQFLNETRMLTFHEFQSLFQDAEIIREKFLFFTKSYIAVKNK